MKKFSKGINEHATKIINFEKKNTYVYQMKKMNHILSKKFVPYAKLNSFLVLIVTVKICF